MALLSRVGLYRGKSLATLGVIYTVLALGGITMFVPFLMTLTTSVTNQYDLPQYNIIPKFIFDDEALFVKFVVAKHPNYESIRRSYRISNANTLTELSESRHPLANNFAPLEYHRWDKEKLAVAWQDWRDFWNEARHAADVSETFQTFYPYETLDGFRRFLRDKYLARWRTEHPAEAATLGPKDQEKAALALLNHTYGTVAGAEFARIGIMVRGITRLSLAERTPRLLDYSEFLSTLPAEAVCFLDQDSPCQEFLREQHVTVENLNRAWETRHTHWTDILFLNRPPAHPRQMADWSKFVTTRMAAVKVRLPIRPSDAEFQNWLLRRHESLRQINSVLKTNFKSLSDIEFSESLPANRKLRLSWVTFAAERIPAAEWRFPNPCQGYQEFLRQRYGSIAKLAVAYGQNYAAFEEIRPPQAAFDRAEFLSRKAHWRWFFLTDNFIQVVQYVAVRGNAFWNTLILVTATLISSLTIDPMAAYALSRFRIKNKQILLILFLMPMAFPGEVSQIPSFLLTRDLGMLNTYWALILPGLANGFGIFLMKGFFDGLPRELYEAAELDGANEWQMYWNVTFPLCKPIMALGAMGTILAAYGGFMWAFIVCPHPDMWTLAVWMFQFSVDAAEQGRVHLQMAALVLMSLPTLVLFIFTQRIIMKGIVLPTMK